MTDHPARKVFKARLETMASPAPKVSPDHPEPMGQPDQSDPKAHKACRVIPVDRPVPKVRKETTVRPALKVRPAR